MRWSIIAIVIIFSCTGNLLLAENEVVLPDGTRADADSAVGQRYIHDPSLSSGSSSSSFVSPSRSHPHSLGGEGSPGLTQGLGTETWLLPPTYTPTPNAQMVDAVQCEKLRDVYRDSNTNLLEDQKASVPDPNHPATNVPVSKLLKAETFWTGKCVEDDHLGLDMKHFARKSDSLLFIHVNHGDHDPVLGDSPDRLYLVPQFNVDKNPNLTNLQDLTLEKIKNNPTSFVDPDATESIPDTHSRKAWKVSEPIPGRSVTQDWFFRMGVTEVNGKKVPTLFMVDGYSGNRYCYYMARYGLTSCRGAAVY